MASSERTLRKMIADLAEMPAPSREAVLSQLGDAQRERVHMLLDEYRGLDPAPNPPMGNRGSPPGLSPWLAELLGEGGETTARGEDAPLTAETLEALRACAAELTTVASTGQKRKGIWQAITERLPARRSQARSR